MAVSAPKRRPVTRRAPATDLSLNWIAALRVTPDDDVASTMPNEPSGPVPIQGPLGATARDCEGVLRSLPAWFGVDASLVQYARDAEVLPTFFARLQGQCIGFVTLRQHFSAAWEVHCIAVRAECRGRGVGGDLLDHAERWLQQQGVSVLQVKTIAASFASPAYAATRAFYERRGHVPLEEFAELWGPRLPCLQMVKFLAPAGRR